ncbi:MULTISPECIES: U32 family peptidase [Terrabacteria group]|uniref:U32 family peptidase n=1 Tax=Bacillati TaxID=1783272 RepID=UPI001C6EB59D|nr:MULTISPECIES: U32 family peptidase [Terrabacteria group]MBW9212248.1 U32 family peptidase [Trueperella sp. zg.1013]
MAIVYNGSMTYLSITIDNLEDVESFEKAGAEEFIFAFQNSCFSSAHSFLKEELIHLKKRMMKERRMAVLMNRLFSQFEIKQAQKDLQDLLEAGIESILFADLALLQKAKELGRMKQLIYSPETLVTSSLDAEIWMSLGLQRAVISPLLTEREIMTISSMVPHLSLPIHGYQMMSVSKRHLLSAYQNYSHLEHSLVRNQKLWIQESHRDGHMPIYEDEFGTVIYTDFVLQSFKYIQKFVERGVERLEMNSHYLSKEENEQAIQSYSKILNGANYEEEEMKYRKAFSNLPLEDGYYGQKTIR